MEDGRWNLRRASRMKMRAIFKTNEASVSKESRGEGEEENEARNGQEGAHPRRELPSLTHPLFFPSRNKHFKDEDSISAPSLISLRSEANLLSQGLASPHHFHFYFLISYSLQPSPFLAPLPPLPLALSFDTSHSRD
jgi:hypothetical protein